MQEPIVLACGLLKSRRDITTKKGDRMAFIQLEDMESHAEIVLFPRTFKKVEQWLDNYHVFVIKGAVDITSQQKCKIKADDCVPIELLLQEWPNVHKISLIMPPRITDATVKRIKDLLGKGKIPLELVFHENGQKLRLTTKEKIAVDSEIITHLEAESIAVRFTL
jgi:DNA polymerase-3 subunit alpha